MNLKAILACLTFQQEPSRGPALSACSLPPHTSWLKSYSTRTANDPVLHADWLSALFDWLLIGQDDKPTKPMRPKELEKRLKKSASH